MPPAIGYYETEPGEAGKLKVFARDLVAKEIIWGWGSDQDRVHGSFYGRQAGPWRRDDTTPWAWEFDEESARTMLKYIDANIDNPSYYNEGEKWRALELAVILRTLVLAAVSMPANDNKSD